MPYMPPPAAGLGLAAAPTATKMHCGNARAARQRRERTVAATTGECRPYCTPPPKRGRRLPRFFSSNIAGHAQAHFLHLHPMPNIH